VSICNENVCAHIHSISYHLIYSWISWVTFLSGSHPLSWNGGGWNGRADAGQQCNRCIYVELLVLLYLAVQFLLSFINILPRGIGALCSLHSLSHGDDTFHTFLLGTLMIKETGGMARLDSWLCRTWGRGIVFEIIPDWTRLHSFMLIIAGAVTMGSIILCSLRHDHNKV